MKTFFTGVILRDWKLFFSNLRFRREFSVSILILGVLLYSLTRFLLYVQNRQGIVLSDPILIHFDPVNLTWLTFGIIYLALFISVINFMSSPVRLLTGIQLYSLMVAVRMISMFLVPLEPPPTMIILNDPFVEFFGTGEVLTRDLFFSGHTATLFILFLISSRGFIKNLLLICTFMVALFVIVQHVHYTIDVFAALFFTYGCFCLLKNIRSKVKYFGLRNEDKDSHK